MTDVLLATANFMALDPKQRRKSRPYPPLAALYAASLLRQGGLQVGLFDATLQPDEGAFAACLESHRPRLVVLYEDNFNFLSKMCLDRMADAALTMAAMARAAGATVAAAGPHVTDHPGRYLERDVQYALVREPDRTTAELAAILLGRASGRPEDVPGVVVADPTTPGRLHFAPGRAPERQLDAFPEAAWDLVDVEAYRRVWTAAHGYFSLNLVTTRGCPFHCNWCAKPIWGQRYAMHSPARVAADLASLKARCRPDHVWFADDIFGLRPAWVTEFAREVAARDARVPFTIQTRADLMTPEAVHGLAQAGCVEAWLGAESGSQQVLDAMDKGTTIEEIAVARRRLGAAGIRAAFFIQFGYPGEEWPQIQETVDMVRRLLPDDIGVSVTYPLPGTGLYERVRQELGAKTQWVDSDDLAMMFQGTYTSEFYRRLHALLHRDLDVRRAGAAGQDVAAEAAAVRTAWDALECDEANHRRADVVSLGARTPSPRPVLALDAN
ncbi:Mg-protoporphyrin IX monomethyl ester oxidative cyclase [Luteitalea sp. TBR-22]|uniref:B12-binding domain-containing radical SAM protein n=1 Tax=Luteitalea sp. TBR-22 TaxID=2802971 RepID=UPI001AFA35CD|nr:radical SAM protein [Luteitalea sp. TBR-22]BCS31746.1 Mg-protoporphyrin IX monomethyl ester oxidative cyclase [Luteitalea sp. TBR-22]